MDYVNSTFKVEKILRCAQTSVLSAKLILDGDITMVRGLALLITALFYIKSGYTCTCTAANFTETDNVQAISTFMESRLGVTESDIVDLQKVESVSFLTKRQKLLGFLDGVISDDIAHQCGMECESGRNERAKYTITFFTSSQDVSCAKRELELEVRMTSNMTNNEGFTTLVKKKTHGTCLVTKQHNPRPNQGQQSAQQY